MNDATAPLRTIRSFVRREGRMTDGQREALERLAAKYSLDSVEDTLDFASCFGRSAPTSLEIGFGNGEALLHRARARPDINHLGIEVHRPGVGRLLMQVEREAITNVRVMTHDAVTVLREQVPAHSLDEIIIEFPDPWHKKRHNKRRLVQAAFVELACHRLRGGGHLRLATDWAPYADQMLAVLASQPMLENLSSSNSWVDRPQSRPVTRFEARGQRLGHAVFDLCFRRKSTD